MANRYVEIYRYEIPATLLFSPFYIFLSQVVAIQNRYYLQRLSILNIIIGSFLFLFLKGISYLPTESSSICTFTLWEQSIPIWLLFYILSAFVRSLLPTIKSIGEGIKDGFLNFYFFLLLILDICLWGYPIFFQMIKKSSQNTSVISWDWLSLYFLFFLIQNLFLLRKWICKGRWIEYILDKCSNVLSLVKKKSISVSEQIPSWSYHFFLLLFVGICIITNLLVVKHVSFFGYLSTAGVLSYPLTFLCIDVVTEVYGEEYAKNVIWMGLISNFILLIGISMAGVFPTALHAPYDINFFWHTFGFVSTSLGSSMIAYLIAQFMSVRVFSALRKKTNGRYLWVRNNAATIISQGVDTFIFALLSWGLWYILPISLETPLGLSEWINIAQNEYLIKILLALLDTPIVYGVLALLPEKKTSK